MKKIKAYHSHAHLKYNNQIDNNNESTEYNL